MLRKRTRSDHKDQHMNHSDNLTQKQKTNSFLKISGLFVGFNPRSSDSDSVRSPTSPLDFRIFSSLGNPFRHSSIHNEAHQQKSWNSSKVGLSIIDSLDDQTIEPGNIIRSFDKKNIILLERQLSVKSMDFYGHLNSPEMPKTEPGFKTDNIEKVSSDVLFEIGEPPFGPGNLHAYSYLTDFGICKSGLGPGSLVLESSKNLMPLESGNISGGTLGSISIGPIPVKEIEHCEDYTCVRTHGPNPKVTHIFGDRVLECHNDEGTVFLEKIENDDKSLETGCPSDVVYYPSNGFLKFCYLCKKELDGEDIYMYRGEKAFCSSNCRSKEIEFEEEMGKADDGIFDSLSSGSGVTSKSGLFITT